MQDIFNDIKKEDCDPLNSDLYKILQEIQQETIVYVNKITNAEFYDSNSFNSIYKKISGLESQLIDCCNLINKKDKFAASIIPIATAIYMCFQNMEAITACQKIIITPDIHHIDSSTLQVHASPLRTTIRNQHRTQTIRYFNGWR